MLILASGSPRRHKLLSYILPDFAVVALPTSEDLPPGTHPKDGVEILAARKAGAVHDLYPDDAVVGADTVVAAGAEVFGKPEDEADAKRMLKALSGREHTVFTGVAILYPGGSCVFSQEAAVRFKELADREIDAYIATREPMDKAGAYGIQEKGALLVEGIIGDFYNVMGLPLCRLNKELAGLGLI